MTATLSDTELRNWLVEIISSPTSVAIPTILTPIRRSRICGWHRAMQWYCPANWPSCWIGRCRRWSSGSTPPSTNSSNISLRLSRRPKLSRPIRQIEGGLTSRSRLSASGAVFRVDIRGPEALWQFLCEGRSAVGQVPPDRWAPFDNGSPEGAAALSGTTRWGSFLTERRRFRRRILRDLAARSGKDGPAAASVARSGLRGVGACRDSG